MLTASAESRSVLAVDVGGGTQDILLWEPGTLVENAVKMVMPSPTVVAARRVAALTGRREPLCLTGFTAGGGAVTDAVRAHIASGLPVFALPEAAATLHDDPARVSAMGVTPVSEVPAGVSRVRLGDLDLHAIMTALSAFGVPFHGRVAVAVQDHGFSPGVSNRVTRFQYWRTMLEAGGDILAFARSGPPPSMTRMLAARRAAPGAVVCDTGLAALLGALLDAPEWVPGGCTVVNVGNFHTVSALMKGGRAFALYEQHTECLTPESLARDLARLSSGDLTFEEVFSAQGHGCAYGASLPPGEWDRVLVTGPRRRLLARPSWREAAPFGDMMMTGCFGLLLAAGFSPADLSGGPQTEAPHAVP